jgi:molybdate transport system substrate-binding protein
LRQLAAFLGLFALLAAVPVCAEAPAPRADQAAGVQTVTVFAAASLKNALDDAAAAFKAKTGVEVRLSYAASLPLAKQIESGAPADLFISADVASMDYLAERKMIAPATRTDFLGNTLVVVAPKDSSLQNLALTKEAFDKALGQGGRLAMGEPASVPAGKYAKAAFEKLGFWSMLEPRAAFADNVRGALVFVARGEAPLGVVYSTDAAAEAKVKIVATFPKDSHPPIVYPIALTAAATGAAPRRFYDYLESDEGRASFIRQGFTALH